MRVNIFYLDRDSATAARYHCDVHVVKMIVETAQLLSTAHHVIDPNGAANRNLYRATHVNHPCAVWVRSSTLHYRWSFELLHALLKEWAHRYGHSGLHCHATFRLLGDLAEFPNGMPLLEWSDPPQCMPDEFRGPSTVMAYRDYYVGEKARFAKWRNGAPSRWPN